MLQLLIKLIIFKFNGYPFDLLKNENNLIDPTILSIQYLNVQISFICFSFFIEC